MRFGLRWAVALEAAVIASLLAYVAASHIGDGASPNYAFISPGFGSDGLKPQSFSVFNFNNMEADLGNFSDENRNLDLSLYIVNLNNEDNFAINGDEGVFPASLNKLPVAVLIMNKVERGDLSLDTQVFVNKSLLDTDAGRIYFENDHLTIRQLLEMMLRESDNSAFYLLLQYVSTDDLVNLIKYYDVDPEHSYSAPSGASLNDTLLSPKSFANIFLSLYFSTTLKPEDSDYLLGILSNTTMDMNRIADLPGNVTVAHKWGAYVNDTRSVLSYVNHSLSVFNDCGIIYVKPNGRLLYCITVRNQSTDDSLNTVGHIVHTIYTFYVSNRQAQSLLKQNFTQTR